MNRNERANDLQQVLIQMLQSWQSGLWTALPGKIVSYDATKQTCSVQPTIQLTRQLRDGTSEIITLPKLVDVPVMFPGAGGYTLTFPVATGDEILVVFASRCIDAWWSLGDPQPQGNLRMHDLSDGFAILGTRNQKRMLSPAPSGNTVQLRSDDGQAKIEIAANHVINITATDVNVTATGNAVVKAASVKLQNAGSALKKLVNETFLQLFDSHTHSNGNLGSPTGVPLTTSTPTNATSVTQAE
jgi:hypothetical protein